MNTAGQKSSRLAGQLREIPEVLECYRLTGSESFIMKVGVSSVQHLERLIDDLSQYGQATTSIVMSVPQARRVIEQKPLLSDEEDRLS
jgi:Lrp/AsnC family leucine-responsive transcriptional regulator